MSVIKLDKYLNSFFKLKLQDADKELYDSLGMNLQDSKITSN